MSIIMCRPDLFSRLEISSAWAFSFLGLWEVDFFHTNRVYENTFFSFDF